MEKQHKFPPIWNDERHIGDPIQIGLNCAQFKPSLRIDEAKIVDERHPLGLLLHAALVAAYILQLDERHPLGLLLHAALISYSLTFCRDGRSPFRSQGKKI